MVLYEDKVVPYSPIQRVLPCPALARVAESQEPELCGEPANMAKSSSKAAASMLSTSSLTSRKPEEEDKVSFHLLG